MPPLNARRSGRLRALRWLALALLVVVAVGSWVAVELGRSLIHEDTLARADAIFVLSGSWLERIAEAGDLYLEGHAPLVVLSQEFPDGAEEPLRARGVRAPSVLDVQIQALAGMGVPREAVQVIPAQEATATEAVALRNLAAKHGWKRVIVVTSKLHTGRARWALRRSLDDIGVEVLLRGSRYDHTNMDKWWENRVTLRIGLTEAQKMLLYWLGAAD